MEIEIETKVMSRISDWPWSRDEVKRAARFLHTIPVDEPYHVKSLPRYVFDYVYNGTLYLDFPWIFLADDEDGQRLKKYYRSHDPLQLARWIEHSPFFLGAHQGWLQFYIRDLKRGHITIHDIESKYLYGKS